MGHIGLVVVIAIVTVAFFVLALSLTLIFKGHNIESEIGTNENMRKRGIRCAAQQIRDEERALRGGDKAKGDGLPEGCSEGGCATCTAGTCLQEEKPSEK